MVFPMTGSFYVPTEIYYGPGSLNKLSKVRLPGKKALIVIGGTSIKKLGYLDRVATILQNRGIQYTVFDKIQPNPIVEHVMEAADLAKTESCDFVIGLGGGSSMDSAKSIALMASNPGHYWDYISAGTGKKQKAPNKALPVVCITTTAGTGTEADPWTVITKEDTKEKMGYGSRNLFPVLSIVDPELMTSIPPHLTAYQGFDALFHSIEGYVAKIASPMSDMFALQAIKYLVQYLPAAIQNGENIEARGYVALASTLSGFVESLSSCTSEHAIEHALSAYRPNLPHGAGLIMISLAYHEAYSPACEDRYSALGTIFGEEASVSGFLRGLEKLQQSCGVSELKMSDYGLTKELIPEYAKVAIETTPGLFSIDRQQLSLDAVINILNKSWK